MNSKVRFHEHLKEIRNEKRLSQKMVSDRLSIPVSTFANWEQGRTEPSISDIYLLLEVFGIDANELFDV